MKNKKMVFSAIFSLVFLWLAAGDTLAAADLKATYADLCYRSKPKYYFNYYANYTAVEADWKIRLYSVNVGDEASLPAWASFHTALFNMFHGQVSSINLTNPMIPALKPNQSTITVWFSHLIIDKEYPWKSVFIFPNKMSEPDVKNNTAYISQNNWLSPCAGVTIK